MAQNTFGDWSATSSSNTSVTGDSSAISIAEGMAPGGVNDALRAIMSAAVVSWGSFPNGTSRPSYLTARQFWVDTTTSTNPVLKYYDGADNITVASFNHTTNTVSFNATLSPNTTAYPTRLAVTSATPDGTITFLVTYGHTLPGDGGHAIYKGVGAEPAHLGKVQAADGSWWELVPDDSGAVYIEQFADPAGFSTDAVAAIVAARNFSDGNVGVGAVVRPNRSKVKVRSRAITLASAVTLNFRVDLDLCGATVTPSADVECFILQKGARLMNCRIDADGLAYTSAAVVFRSDGTNTIGDNTSGEDSFTVENVRVELPANSGTAFWFDTSTNNTFIQGIRMRGLNVVNGAIAAFFDGTGTGGAYLNACEIHDIVIRDSAQAFRFEGGVCNGNMVRGAITERQTAGYTAFNFVGANRNAITSSRLWDSPPFNFDAASHDNHVEGVVDRFPTITTDLGTNNRIEVSGGIKRGQFSWFHSVDTRAFSDGARGFIEVVNEPFLLGYKANAGWNQALTGTGTISAQSNNMEGASGNQQRMPRHRFNVPAAADVAELNFNGLAYVYTTNNPKMMITCTPNGGTTGIIRVGLMDANTGANGIYLEVDNATHGDDNARLVVSNTSTRTLLDTGVDFTSTAFTAWLACEIRETVVYWYFGRSNTGGGGNLDDLDRGARFAYTSAQSGNVFYGPEDATADVTTNLPTAAMQPMIYVTDTAGGAWCDMMHFSVYMGAGIT